MRLLKPPRLVEGDTIGVIAPSLPVLPNHQERYDLGIENLRKFGFRIKEGQTVKLQHWGYMAGTDAQRAEDINAMFADEEVRAIICALGGSVAVRTLPQSRRSSTETHFIKSLLKKHRNTQYNR